MASPDYLADVTGKTELVDFDKLIKELGLKGILPDIAQQYLDSIDEAESDGVHQYLCNIGNLPSDRNCDVSKAITKREKDRFVGYAQWDTSQPLKLLYMQNGQVLEVDPFALKKQPKPLPLEGNRYKAGRNLRGANTGASVSEQGVENIPDGTFYTRSIKDDLGKDRDANNKIFTDAVNGGEGRSIGDRAVFFNPDGSVTKGANNVRNKAISIG
jgi:hypothetical protein